MLAGAVLGSLGMTYAFLFQAMHLPLHYESLVIGNVTVGIHAVILPGVIIEDDAIVASGSIVTKGTHILRGEMWGGASARRLEK